MGVDALIHLLVVLLIIAVCFGLFVSYVVPAIPLPSPFPAIIIAIAALIVIVILISYLPGGGGFGLRR